MLTALFTIVIFLVPTFFVVSVDNTNANLIVSSDEMKKNLVATDFGRYFILFATVPDITERSQMK